MNERRKLLSEDSATGISIVDGYEAVDLGLPSGVLWATGDLKKVGNVYSLADPYTEDASTFFSYGNTTGHNRNEFYDNKKREVFSPDYYNTYTKGGLLTAPFTSGNSKYDAARKNMGGGWRIPTTDEVLELIDNCSWSANDSILIGTNAGNEIFMRPNGARIVGTTSTSDHCIMLTGYNYSLFDNTSRVYGSPSEFKVTYRNGTCYPTLRGCLDNVRYNSGTTRSDYAYNGIYVRAVHDAI